MAQALPELAANDAIWQGALLDIPSAHELRICHSVKDYDPELVKAQREGLYQQLALALKRFNGLSFINSYQYRLMKTVCKLSVGNRALRAM